MIDALFNKLKHTAHYSAVLCLPLLVALPGAGIVSAAAEEMPETAGDEAADEAAKPLPVEMSTRLTGREVYPGDEITLEITFSSEKPFAADVPGAIPLGEFDLKDRTVRRGEEDGRHFVRHSLKLIQFKTGTYDLPRIPFVLRQSGRQEERQSDALRVKVKSVIEEEALKIAMQKRRDREGQAQRPGGPGAELIDPGRNKPIGPTFNLPQQQGQASPPAAPAAPDQPMSGRRGVQPEPVQLEPRDIKGPVPLMQKSYLLLYLLGALLAVMLIAAGVWLWLRYRRPPEAVEEDEPVDTRPAHLIAFERLLELERRQLVAKRELKEYHLQLSEILRDYFSRRYSLTDALSMTSTEIAGQLGRMYLRDLNEKVIVELFAAGDLVKFARDEPSDEVCFESLKLARMIVERTKEERVGIQ